MPDSSSSRIVSRYCSTAGWWPVLGPPLYGMSSAYVARSGMSRASGGVETDDTHRPRRALMTGSTCTMRLGPWPGEGAVSAQLPFDPVPSVIQESVEVVLSVGEETS